MKTSNEETDKTPYIKKADPRTGSRNPRRNSLNAPFCAITEAIRVFAEKSSTPASGKLPLQAAHEQDGREAQLRPEAHIALQAVAEQRSIDLERIPGENAVSHADRSLQGQGIKVKGK